MRGRGEVRSSLKVGVVVEEGKLVVQPEQRVHI